MAVLSVDLAFRRWSDLGIVVLDRVSPAQVAGPGALRTSLPLTPLCSISDKTEEAGYRIDCEIIPSLEKGLDGEVEPGRVDANVLAGRLNHLCGVRKIGVMMLDGPQAWKSRFNGLDHARVSERQLNTAAKTGLPGMVKPVTYRAFAEFCLDLYEALCRRGWSRMSTHPQPVAKGGQFGTGVDDRRRILVESYPHAAWRSLGIKPLPSKRRARISDLAEAFGALGSIFPITTNRPPNHDQLQAIVGGLPGLDLERHNIAALRIVGNPPCREEGQWREGFIVLPQPPTRTVARLGLSGLRWLS
jgi:hypothetical protein